MAFLGVASRWWFVVHMLRRGERPDRCECIALNIGGATLCFQHVTDSFFDSMIRAAIRILTPTPTRQPAVAAPVDGWRAAAGVGGSSAESQRIATHAGSWAGVLAR